MSFLAGFAYLVCMSNKKCISKDELQQRLDSGESLRQIAKSIGVTHQTLCWHRDNWGLERIRKCFTRKPSSTGRFTDQWGYVMIRTSNRAGALAYTPEHILVAEESLGRKLLPTEVVHHINGIKNDNRAENIHVCTRKEHMTIHKDLESLAMELVNKGHIVFQDGTYRWAT